jgi:hypothetical protein
MKLPIKRLSFFALAVAIGGVTFGLVWLPEAAAATCSAGPATMCYKGSTVNNVPTYLQTQYLNNGGYCGKCNPTSGT